MFLRWLKNRKRERLKRRPFPAEWRDAILRNVPYFRYLSPGEREELLRHVQILMAEKVFEGLNGLEMTDEIRTTISALAGILLLGRETDYYPGLISILVYPATYVVPTRRRMSGGIVAEDMEQRLGESWHHGEVVLSWRDVLRGAMRFREGRNVVFHEFAHQLDDENGATNGTPVLPRRSMYAEWSRVFNREFEKLREDLKWGRPTSLDPYAAESPAEFFAVATETFFEAPEKLESVHPDLYGQLKLFYRQDPAARFRNFREDEPASYS